MRIDIESCEREELMFWLECISPIAKGDLKWRTDYYREISDVTSALTEVVDYFRDSSWLCSL